MCKFSLMATVQKSMQKVLAKVEQLLRFIQGFPKSNTKSNLMTGSKFKNIDLVG